MSIVQNQVSSLNGDWIAYIDYWHTYDRILYRGQPHDLEEVRLSIVDVNWDPRTPTVREHDSPKLQWRTFGLQPLTYPHKGHTSPYRHRWEDERLVEYLNKTYTPQELFVLLDAELLPFLDHRKMKACRAQFRPILLANVLKNGFSYLSLMMGDYHNPETGKIRPDVLANL